MSWVAKPHVCDLPNFYHGSRVGLYFECDHCKRTWTVIGETGPNQYGQYTRLVYASRVGDIVEKRNYGDLS